MYVLITSHEFLVVVVPKLFSSLPEVTYKDKTEDINKVYIDGIQM